MKHGWALCIALVVLLACSGDDKSTADAGNDAAPTMDGGTDGSSDAANDGSNDQGAGDADAAATVYSALGDKSKWSTFDVSKLKASSLAYAGVAFDGRYVYFAPYLNFSNNSNGVVMRYDTTAAFSTSASWSTFDVSTVNGGARGFFGAVFDGRYVYFVPNNATGNNLQQDGLVTRYDTLAAFTTGSSWSTFDASTVNANAVGFMGATFDGRYVYFVPNYNSSNAFSGLVTRYDTLAAFTMGSSWSTFDATTVNATAKGFEGAVFDGRYVYFVPNKNNLNNIADGLVVRYDTQATFTTSGSWSAFDMTTVNASAGGCVGGVFDGRYVYFVPSVTPQGSYNTVLARYDTQANFTAVGSWSTFDLATVALGYTPGFAGAAFDGRYVYFEPDPIGGGTTANITRYDTQAAFTTTSSWEAFSTTTLIPSGAGFFGGAFDGRYLYFAPNFFNVAANTGGFVARFDAKSPPMLPAGPAHGSFF